MVIVRIRSPIVLVDRELLRLGFLVEAGLGIQIPCFIEDQNQVLVVRRDSVPHCLPHVLLGSDVLKAVISINEGLEVSLLVLSCRDHTLDLELRSRTCVAFPSS